MFSSILQPIIPLLFLSTARGSPTRNQQIQWGDCEESINKASELTNQAPVQCATLEVPLDYSSLNSTEKLTLELARAPATIQPSKGTIQLNFGGPGSAGRASLAQTSSIYMNFTGGHYDLVAFDARGTSKNFPFTCFPDPADLIKSSINAGLPSTGSDVAEGQLWAAGTVNANACLATQAKNGSLINTPYYARDLISVVDALGEDGMLRFWGLSYGTTVASTVAVMFPERIDKMVFDGVQNPHEYYYALGDFEEWTDSDKVFSAIFSTCFDFPENCVLAKDNVTAIELERAAWDLIDRVKYHPIVLGTTVIDYSALRGIIALNLYDAVGWPVFTQVLDLLISRENDTQALELITKAGWLATTSTSVEPLTGIRCVDRQARTSSFEEFKPTIDKLHNRSRIYGDLTVSLMAACAQWKIDSPEKIHSDFHVKTKNPVLFVGNTWDGHTPLKSAKNVSSTFEGSGLLEINGYGHGSHVLPSLCSLKAISAYWTDGVLPEPGTVCPVEGVPYSNITWPVIYAAAASNETASN